MFSRLEPLFKTTFREAESTDTRQGIRREEREENRKRDEKEQKDQNSQDLWTDSTSVSVGALKVFLMNFLQNQIEKDKQNDGSMRASSAPVPIQSGDNKPTTLGGRAAMAYQNMAGQNKSKPIIKPDPGTSVTNSMDNKDVRLMNRLIEDLSVLESRNVQALNIARAGTFLESLIRAVDLEMQKI